MCADYNITTDEGEFSDKALEDIEKSKPPKNDCFIATAAYGTPFAEEIEILRDWRDKFLLRNTIGVKLVNIYYNVSPPIAKYIAKSNRKRYLVRVMLKPFVWVVRQIKEYF